MKKRAESDPPAKRLEDEFKGAASLAGRFAAELTRQIQELLDANSISLSFPIQQRVKAWASLSEKLERKALALKSLRDLDDFVGLRLILQFRPDVSKVCELIEQNFKVLKKYDTGDRLDPDQFGYSSTHLVVELSDSWLAVPTFSQMRGWRAEVQVRTTAQHIWAAASHTLQYKQESSAPALMRRGLYRISALLETIDLEFERLLEQRHSYRDDASQVAATEPLNVDLLEKVLNGLLPEKNKTGEEDYADLLSDLSRSGIADRQGLTEMIEKHLTAALARDRDRVKELKGNPAEHEAAGATESRLGLGVFFSHTGLARECLSQAVGTTAFLSLFEKGRKG
jgi:ppGpp synthetase/RelA/SpoT-type nucleotidyltranferase